MELAAFLGQHVAPHVDSWERDRTATPMVIRQLGRSGLLTTSLGDKLTLADQLARTRSLGIATGVLAHLDLALPLLANHAADRIRDAYLKPSLSGDLVAAVGLAEPRPVIETKRDHLVVDGTAAHVINVPGADYLVVVGQSRGRTGNGDREGERNQSLVLVPLDAQRLRARRVATLGLHTAGLGEVDFDKVRVSRDHLIGEAHQAERCVQPLWMEHRILVSAALLALVDEALKDVVDYVTSRPFGSQTLGNLQAVRHRLADLRAEYEIAAALLRDTSAAMSEGGHDQLQSRAAMVQLVCGEAAERIVEACAQLFGGSGYLAANWITRAYRDTRSTRIIAGSPNVAKEIIARELGL